MRRRLAVDHGFVNHLFYSGNKASRQIVARTATSITTKKGQMKRRKMRLPAAFVSLAPSLLSLVLILQSARYAQGYCFTSTNDCSGHGVCSETSGVSYKTCSCQSGWGASTDIAYYKAPDCSMRICPAGKAFASVPTGEYTAHEVCISHVCSTESPSSKSLCR